MYSTGSRYMSILLTMYKEKQTNFTKFQLPFRPDLLPSHLLFINTIIKMHETSALVVVPQYVQLCLHISQYVQLCLHIQKRAQPVANEKGWGGG